MGDEREEEEEMVKDEKSEKFTPKTSSYSPILLRKRPLLSTSSVSSQQVIHCRKKTRDLPNISNCHSCGLRFPDKGRNETLQPLRSEWRVVFLCSSCLRSIKSAKVCSYCFSDFDKLEEDQRYIDCRICQCRVHLTCIPNQRGYVMPSDLDPCLFTCVDCCALPKCFSVKRGSSYGGSCSINVSRIRLEDAVRDASSVVAKKAAAASCAKQKALLKAVAAKHATELARSALDLALLASKGKRSPETIEPAPLHDEELALRLHRAMNGSQRISRKHRSTNLKHLSDSKREFSNSFKEDQICTENRSFLGLGDSESLVHAHVSEDNSSLNLDSWRNDDSKKVKDEESKNSLEDMPVKEGQASCSDKVINSAGDDDSDVSVSASCQRSNGSYCDLRLLRSSGEGEDSAATQQKETSGMPDRYFKKYYCKRHPRLRVTTVDNKESIGSVPALVPHLYVGCSNASRTFSNAAYESPTVAMHVSANVSGLSGCGT